MPTLRPRCSASLHTCSGAVLRASHAAAVGQGPLVLMCKRSELRRCSAKHAVTLSGAVARWPSDGLTSRFLLRALGCATITKISGDPHCTQGPQPDRGRLRQLELSARCAACPSSHMLADLLQAARPPALHTVGIRVQPPRLVGRPHSLDSSDKHDRPQPHNSCTTAACSGLPVLLMAVRTVRPSTPRWPPA